MVKRKYRVDIQHHERVREWLGQGILSISLGNPDLGFFECETKDGEVAKRLSEMGGKLVDP